VITGLQKKNLIKWKEFNDEKQGTKEGNIRMKIKTPPNYEWVCDECYNRTCRIEYKDADNDRFPIKCPMNQDIRGLIWKKKPTRTIATILVAKIRRII